MFCIHFPLVNGGERLTFRGDFANSLLFPFFFFLYYLKNAKEIKEWSTAQTSHVKQK